HTPGGRRAPTAVGASSIGVRARPTGGTVLALGGAWVPGEPGAPGSAEREPARGGCASVSPAIRGPGPAAESGGAAGPHLPHACGQRAPAAGGWQTGTLRSWAPLGSTHERVAHVVPAGVDRARRGQREPHAWFRHRPAHRARRRAGPDL